MTKNYKETLLMPHTNFEMRANLIEKEPLLQKFWQEQNIYQNLITKNKTSGKTFILHDGPPYANGDLHLGHALNKILKDIIVRYYNSNNYYAPYIPGWDTHGLPIETAVTNSGINRKTTTVSDFRKQCQNYAQIQVANQISQFKTLGLLTDFQDYYVTYDKNYESQQIKVFATMVEKKLVYRNLYPVYWSPSSESALAEAEIEYLTKTSAAIYVAFLLNNDKNQFALPTSLVIWTTTPWTIPANQMLAVNENVTYTILKFNNHQYIVGQDLVSSFTTTNNITDFEIVATITGNQLVGLTALHPLYNRKTPVVHGYHVTTSNGTGVVHIAPCFGEEDFDLGKKHNLKILSPINDQGYFTSEINDSEIAGKFYEETNKIIVTKLKDNGTLIGMKWFKHQYPHDWRTKKPVIYRATLQWFIAIEKIKPLLAKNINSVNFLPEWAKKRMLLMTSNRFDWCISRQRVWGLPIPIFYSENKQPIMDYKLINHVATLFATNGSNIWFEKDVKDLLPPGYKHKDSPNGIFYKEQDIMDVWYDSGVSHLATIKDRKLPWPVDLYLEGNDQFRGWFNSSLITGVITNGHSPYKNLLAHGFVTDAKGNKMSKSLGNVISVKSICETNGADILRLWVTSVDFQDDTRIGTEILKQVSENYRKIRNLLRFLLGNCFDLDIKKINESNHEELIINLNEVDQFILHKLNILVDKINGHYQSYEFNTIYQLILNFITNDLSAFYCDFTKDILYVNHKNDIRRKQVQTTMFLLLKTLMGLLAPILPHTTEESFHSLFNLQRTTTNQSLHSQPFPKSWEWKLKPRLIDKWEYFIAFKNDVNKAIEDAKKDKLVKSALEAMVTISFLEKNNILQTISIKDMAQLLIVSDVSFTLHPTNITKDWTITISAKIGTKCPRCWLIVDEIKDDVCNRCYEVLFLNKNES